MQNYRGTTLGGLATDKLKASAPSCYSKEFDECLDSPTAHPGAQCAIWYANTEAAIKENEKEYDKIIAGIPYCSNNSNLITVAIVVGLGLLAWKLV